MLAVWFAFLFFVFPLCIEAGWLFDCLGFTCLVDRECWIIFGFFFHVFCGRFAFLLGARTRVGYVGRSFWELGLHLPCSVSSASFAWFLSLEQRGRGNGAVRQSDYSFLARRASVPS